jgi:phage-related protein
VKVDDACLPQAGNGRGLIWSVAHNYCIEELEVIPRQYFKKLADSEGIWEVRIQFGNDVFRLLGFFDGGTLLILTNGFAKKTQKTPSQEIALAVRRKEEYLARRKKS